MGTKLIIFINHKKLFRNFSSAAWSYNFETLSKGPKSTSWLWAIHSMPHDFSAHSSGFLKSYTDLKVISANIAHLSLLSLWLSALLFNGGYSSNFSSWLASPKNVRPSAQQIWTLV